MHEYVSREEIIVARSEEVSIRSHFRIWWLKAQGAQLFRERAALMFKKRVWFNRMRRIQIKAVNLEQQLQDTQSTQQASLTKKYFGTWFHKTLGIHAQVYYERNLAQKCLDSWILALEDITNLNDRAIVFKKRATTHAVLKKWMNSMQGIKSNSRIADAYQRRLLLRRTWNSWTAATILKLSKDEVEVICNESIVHQYFNQWKKNTDMAITADIFYQFSIAQRFFKRMRESLRERLLSGSRERLVMRNTLYTWVLRERSELLNRVVNRRLLKRKLKIWRHATVKRIDRDQKSINSVYESTNYRMVSEVFQSWKRRTAVVNDMYNRALVCLNSIFFETISVLIYSGF